MNIGLQIARAVAKELDTDHIHELAKDMGSQAVGLMRAQITGLESVANGTRKISDVLDYLKLRTARHEKWRVNQIGGNLITILEQDLRKTRDRVWSELATQITHSVPKPEHAYLQQDIYLRLIRGFVAQVAAQYEYATMQIRAEQEEVGQ